MENHENYEIKENCLVIHLPKEIDHHSAKDIRRYADYYMNDTRVEQLVFDFQNTEFMDSSGIGLLAGRNERIASIGGRTIVINANPRILKILKIAGLYEELCIVENDR